MISIKSSAMGDITDARQAKEHWLVLSAIDCAMRHKVGWVANVMTWFRPDYIIDPYYRLIFSAVLAMDQETEAITAESLADGLFDAGKEYQRTLRDCVNLISECHSQAGHIGFYAKEVHQEYRKRHASVDLADASGEMATTQDPDSVFDRIQEIPSKYAPSPENRSGSNSEVFDGIMDEIDGKRENGYLRFGIYALDNSIDGIPPTALVTIGARTGNGKSVFLCQTALKCADVDNKPVLFFSLEMSQEEIYKRWASALSRQPLRGGNRRELIGGFGRLRNMVSNSMLEVFTGPRTVEKITADAISYTCRCNVGLICVDYVQAVSSTRSRQDGREQQVAHVAASLKALAAATGVPVLTATQLNKTGELNPRLSAIRESEAIANYSDIVLLFSPEETTDSKINLPIDIAKFRGGARNYIHTTWEKPIFTIRDKEEHDPS